MRITVSDVLGWLAAGMSHQDILMISELTEEDIALVWRTPPIGASGHDSCRVP